ncbi:hypothetical protein [Paenibacillus sp. YSY-4.3]
MQASGPIGRAQGAGARALGAGGWLEAECCARRLALGAGIRPARDTPRESDPDSA